MNKRFIKIFESTLNRYTNGGFLVGDIVKLKRNCFHHPFFENQEELKFKLKSIEGSDLNIRVVNIKCNHPAVGGGANDDYNTPRHKFAEIAQEYAPGRWRESMIIPIECLELHPSYPNLPSIPDSMKRKDTSHIKPKPVVAKKSEDNETRKSDVGGKMVSGDRELLNKNVKIPSSPAKDSKDPANYTAMYMPKK